ncbi:efflux RND transporter periplasmic adaptor subunit [bacterium SCSIO 12643]|nr:efflux RND transporter periplasmic adaptor subunit [bacterium SCSIO 12643]
MKKLIYISLAFVAASCASKTTEDYLTELNTKRDSIKAEYRTLGAELAKIEAQITALDTTRKVVNVTARKADRTTFRHFFKIYGSIQTDNNTLVYPSAQGEITRVFVEEGQPVSKGQTLYAIDSEILRKSMDEVKVQIELAKDVYNKQEKLWKQNIGSEMDYLRAKNNLDALNTKKETLKAQISKTNVTAPFSGTIDEIMIKNGQLVSPGVATMRIVNLDKVYLKADVPEGYIKTIGRGTPVNVTFPSINESVKTNINETGRFINPANRTFTARINLENQNNKLYPNLLGMLEIQDYQQDSALVIPARLIQENAQGDSYIFTVKTEGDATYSILKPIEVGMTYNGVTEVLSGLHDQDMIIDKGSRSVSDNQLIRVTK